MTAAAPAQGKLKRGRRPTRIGVVASDVRDKTIKVTVEYSVRHPKYGKYLRRRTALHAHDEKNEARVGDIVELAACRPISKSKHWRLLRILGRAPQPAEVVAVEPPGAQP